MSSGRGEDDPDRFLPVKRLAETVPTRKDARVFSDLLVERLGPRALMQTANGANSRELYVRAGGASGDGSLVIPWPLLSLWITDPPPGGPPEDQPHEVIALEPPPPGEPFRIPLTFQPTPASLSVRDGDLALTVNYHWSGKRKETVAPAEPDAFAELPPAVGAADAGAIERLTDYVASLDLGRHGPARVLQPQPTFGGVAGTWRIACRAIRQALAARKTPAGSFWAVADGYAGTVIAFGASRDEALAAWREEVERVRPRPPPPPERPQPETADPLPTSAPREWTPDEPDEEGQTIRIFASGWDSPTFDPSPAAVPAGVVRVAALPKEKPARGEWSRWLGQQGVTHFAVRIPAARGFTLVGQSLLARFDLAAIDATLDGLDAARPDLFQAAGTRSPGGVELKSSIVLYRCVDHATKLPIDPRIEQTGFGPSFDAGGFDGSLLRTHLVRVRDLG